jgi:hypothetical protein
MAAFALSLGELSPIGHDLLRGVFSGRKNSNVALAHWNARLVEALGRDTSKEFKT